MDTLHSLKTSCWELALKRKKQCSFSSKEELESLPLLVELVELVNQLLVDSEYDSIFWNKCILFVPSLPSSYFNSTPL